MLSYSIITCQGGSNGLCAYELKSILVDFIKVKWIGQGIGLLSHSCSFKELSNQLKTNQLIFTRHIFPVNFTLDFNIATFEQNSPVFDALLSFLNIMEITSPFSVQIRGESMSAGDIKEVKGKFADYFINKGFSYEVAGAKSIISAFINKGNIYMGLSFANENLSSWSGGMRRFAMREDTVSRAEFKLLEAFEVFEIDISFAGLALDLGASPGGWTKVLTERGMKVIAVDPAELSPQVINNPNVVHYNGLAQRFIRTNKQKFDLIVNDMRMDVIQSSQLMLDVSKCLNNDGLVIMTFKLPKNNPIDYIKKGTSILNTKYNVLHVKQLFNNRSEVTVVLQKKP